MHDRGFRGGRVTGLLLVLALALPAASPAGAAPRDDSRESVPSFNESPGCNDLDGIRGPLASHVGVLGPAEPLYGPWADYYGRTIRDVMDQLVLVHLPGLSKDLYLHDRVLPAFNQVLANLAVAASKGRTNRRQSELPVIDCSGPVVEILREGPITARDIERALRNAAA